MQHLNLVDEQTCPECNCKVLITDVQTGETACSQCGLVVHVESLDQRPEYRAYTHQEWVSRLRTGVPTSLRMYDKGLSTSFLCFRDVHGRSLPRTVQSKMRRLWTWQVRARLHSTAQKNLWHAMTALAVLTQKLHLPIIVEENAALIYRRIRKIPRLQKRPIHVLIAASCYAACRLTKTPRTLRKLAAASSRSRKEIGRCYRLIRRHLLLKVPNENPTHYVTQIASKLGISYKTQQYAIDLLHHATQRHITSGKNPVSLTAASLYLAAQLTAENTSQKCIAREAGVTEVTLRTRYQELDRTLQLGVSQPPSLASQLER